jgi:hypothetical protein
MVAFIGTFSSKLPLGWVAFAFQSGQYFKKQAVLIVFFANDGVQCYSRFPCGTSGLIRFI